MNWYGVMFSVSCYVKKIKMQKKKKKVFIVYYPTYKKEGNIYTHLYKSHQRHTEELPQIIRDEKKTH